MSNDTTTLIRILSSDKEALERMKEERGFRTMGDLIHWILYVDTSKNQPYDQLEMEVRKLRLRLEEMEGKR